MAYLTRLCMPYAALAFVCLARRTRQRITWPSPISGNTSPHPSAAANSSPHHSPSRHHSIGLDRQDEKAPRSSQWQMTYGCMVIHIRMLLHDQEE
ncbi:hypothetical protein EJB05_24224, partial [Eragrostis curvula]